MTAPGKQKTMTPVAPCLELHEHYSYVENYSTLPETDLLEKSEGI